MTYAKRSLISVLCGLLLLAALAAPCAASYPGACSAGEATKAYRLAHRAALRAEAREREARHVLRATLHYRDLYGGAVARWTRLARRSGYTWAEMPVLMLTIYDESRGDPEAVNTLGSGAVGLLQVMPEWADGSKVDYWNQWHLSASWDRTNPTQTLVHCSHMAWSNWGR